MSIPNYISRLDALLLSSIAVVEALVTSSLMSNFVVGSKSLLEFSPVQTCS